MVKDAQVGVLRRKRMEGKTQEAAAAAAAMSVRIARKWEHGLAPSQRRKPRTWRTRADPFDEVFESELVPLLAADRDGSLEATTLLSELNRRQPGRFGVGQLRTLQRRVGQWRALNGPEKEVFFPQEHPPGREAAYDFTNCDELGVTISGAAFDHLWFELVLSFSGWRWPAVALSESFEALALGVQAARPVGRPSSKPVVWFKSFPYQAASWKTARWLVAKVEFHFGNCSPRRVHRDQPHGGEPAVLRPYDKRGTAKQWIKEGKQAVKMTRLSCHRFRANEVRLWLRL